MSSCDVTRGIRWPSSWVFARPTTPNLSVHSKHVAGLLTQEGAATLSFVAHSEQKRKLKRHPLFDVTKGECTQQIYQ